MKRYRVVCIAIAATLLHTACAAGPIPRASNAPSESRFRVPGELVLADSSEVKPVHGGLLPRYPAEMKASGGEAGFAALFVLDTTGRVEYPTVSFTSDVARPFQVAVCSYLRSTRFTPVIRDGVSRRALVIAPWTFGLEGGIWQNRLYDAEPLRQALVAEGLPSAVAQLEAQPHC
jgi:hypothetical protein